MSLCLGKGRGQRLVLRKSHRKIVWDEFRKSLESHNKKPKLYSEKMEIDKRLLNRDITSKS